MIVPINFVSAYSRSFFRENPYEHHYSRKERVSIENTKKFRIAINGGYTYWYSFDAGYVSQDFREYFEELKTGNFISGDLSYFFEKNYGLGIKLNHFTSSNFMSNVGYIDEFDNVHIGDLSHKMRFTFIGGSFLIRPNSITKNQFTMVFSLGILNYKNSVNVVTENSEITSSTIGLNLDLEYAFNVSTDFQLALLGSLSGGSFSYFDESYNNSGKVRYNSTGAKFKSARLNLGIGLRLLP
jgi:hypothetical protein